MNGESEDWIDVEIENSFKYSNTEDRVTTGIWIYSEPVIRKDREGNDIAVFLMDTQGWHDDKTSIRDSALIFGLASLISSVMIFNVDKRIGEDDLCYLQNFSSNAKMLGGMDNEPFQNLVFLIRDWMSIDESDGYPFGYYDSKNPREDRDFIADKWDPEGKSDEAQKIREMLSLIYEGISAYLLPPPGKVIYYDKFDSKKMDPEFNKHLLKFCSTLFDNNGVIVKQINGRSLKGRELVYWADLWQKEFHFKPKNSVPAIDESPYLIGYQAAIDYFNIIMKNKISNGGIEELRQLIQEQRSQLNFEFNFN